MPNRAERRRQERARRKIRVTRFDFTYGKFPPLPTTNSAVTKCYAAPLLSCAGSISKEHFVSENILRQIGSIEPAGIPWLNHMTQPVPYDALAANCLCERHNSYLSPLDAVAGGAFKAFRRFADLHPEVTRISGLLLERWMLKVLAGLIATGKVPGVDRAALSPDWLRVIFGLDAMPNDCGIHILPEVGQRVGVSDYLSIRPASNNGVPVGLLVSLAGFNFYCTLLPKDRAFQQSHPHYGRIMYRVRGYNKLPTHPQAIDLVW